MPISNKRRFANLKRKPPSSSPRKKFHIFCEGKNTERVYFDAVRQEHCVRTLVEIAYTGACGDPMCVANRAVEKKREIKKDSFAKYDEVWAVFDRDQHDRFDEAIDLCASHGVLVGWSNPCFEVWVILHIEDYNKSDDADEVQRYLEKKHPAYIRKGSKTPDCVSLLKNLAAAESRAENLLALRETESNPRGRPSTTVGWLTSAICKAAKTL